MGQHRNDHNNWEDIVFLRTEMTDGSFLSSNWSLIMLSCIWLYFAVLFAYFEIRHRWTQFTIVDKVESEYENGSVSKEATNLERCYTVRIRSDALDSSYRDTSASIHIKFLLLKEKLGQLIITINSYRKHGTIYTSSSKTKYHVILFHWYTTSNLSNVDEIRIAHSSKPESPQIFLRDLDVREPELQIRIHCKIFRSIEPFPFVPGSGISLKPINLSPETSDDFRSPFEKITQTEVIIFMFVQSNITQTSILWLPTFAPLSRYSTSNAIVYGLTFYSITTLLILMCTVYYQMIKIRLTPLRKTNLKRFRKTFILAICTVTALLLIIASLVATKYPKFPIMFWLVLCSTGLSFQALAIFIVFYWYNKKFTLELSE